VLILAVLIYYLLILLRGTRAMGVLKGLAILFGLYILADILKLNTLVYIIQLIFPGIIVGLVILFQQEIRRGLTAMGQRRVFKVLMSRSSLEMIDEIVKAVHLMSQRRIGALIVLEQDASLSRLIEAGVKLDAEANAKLLVSIFTPYTPLHDGAVVISDGRIAAASALLPLTENPDLDPELGTRHRAAIGLSEQVDAIVIVVSEERGTISLAIHGDIEPCASAEDLRRSLTQILGLEKETKPAA
jgi:uncharacterized protein (TIGR00159 family)